MRNRANSEAPSQDLFTGTAADKPSPARIIFDDTQPACFTLMRVVPCVINRHSQKLEVPVHEGKANQQPEHANTDASQTTQIASTTGNVNKPSSSSISRQDSIKQDAAAQPLQRQPTTNAPVQRQTSVDAPKQNQPQPPSTSVTNKPASSDPAPSPAVR